MAVNTALMFRAELRPLALQLSRGWRCGGLEKWEAEAILGFLGVCLELCACACVCVRLPAWMPWGRTCVGAAEGCPVRPRSLQTLWGQWASPGFGQWGPSRRLREGGE